MLSLASCLESLSLLVENCLDNAWKVGGEMGCWALAVLIDGQRRIPIGSIKRPRCTIRSAEDLQLVLMP